MRLFLLTICTLFSCATPPPIAPAPDRPVESAPSPPPTPEPDALPEPDTPPEPVKPTEPARPPTPSKPPPALDFVEWVVSHCVIEALPATKYARGWMDWTEGDTSFLPPRAPAPVKGPRDIPAAGSEAARQKADALRREWQRDPKSRLIDCGFRVPRRACPGCKDRSNFNATSHYTALLPRALFEDPDAVRSMLFLVPGGNGGRVRWFLTPVPGKGLRDAMSGGLETRRHVDAWIEAHPEASQPIVIALEHNGWGTPNGPTEFLAQDAPTHIRETFLGGRPRSALVVGVDGISSGSMAALKALKARPESFNTVGLMCMYCADEAYIRPITAYGDTARRRQWLSTLKALTDEGRLAVRFSVGNADISWTCNKTWHDLFVEGGLFPDTPPTLEDCQGPDPPSPETCTARWEGFVLYNGVGHTYAMLMPAWIPELHWQLQTLDMLSKNLP